MMTMRKGICLMIAVILCLGLAVPGFAAETDFVPSITYKPEPEMVPAEGEHFGVLRDEAGNVLDYIDRECVSITPLAHVWDEEIQIPAEIDELLRFVYESLNDGSMKLPYEKFDAGVDPADMVIRDLLDISWVSEERQQMMEDGATLELTFDLGVAPDEQVYVMTYDEVTGEWNPIVKTVNNGDGTITCTFDRLCVVAFSTSLAEDPVEPDEEAPTNPQQSWITSLIQSVVGFVTDLIDWIKKLFF